MDKKEEILDDFYNYLKKEKSYSNHTIKAYKNDLSRFLAFLPKKISGFDKVNRESIRGFLESEIDRKDMNKPVSNKTIARRLASVKSFFKYLLQSEQIINLSLIHI